MPVPNSSSTSRLPYRLKSACSCFCAAARSPSYSGTAYFIPDSARICSFSRCALSAVFSMLAWKCWMRFPVSRPSRILSERPRSCLCSASACRKAAPVALEKAEKLETPSSLPAAPSASRMPSTARRMLSMPCARPAAAFARRMEAASASNSCAAFLAEVDTSMDSASMFTAVCAHFLSGEKGGGKNHPRAQLSPFSSLSPYISATVAAYISESASSNSPRFFIWSKISSAFSWPTSG